MHSPLCASVVEVISKGKEWPDSNQEPSQAEGRLQDPEQILKGKINPTEKMRAGKSLILAIIKQQSFY